MRNPDYLGDGLYIYYDGYGIELRANHHENPTDRVYLEPSVYNALVDWVKALNESEKEAL